MANESLKNFIRGNGITLWEVAEKIGITDSSFSRKLRHELSEEEAEKIRASVLELVDEIQAERRV